MYRDQLPWPAVAILICALAMTAITSALPATTATTAPAAQPDVLIVQHAYDGPIESAGALVGYRYTGGHMLIEWVDTTTDGVFRNGFEGAP